jgi:glycerol-3-phosphate acyltransferase PlsX
MREEFTRNTWGKVSSLISYPVLKQLRHRLDPRGYNGASLVGLRRIVVKSHGGADAHSFGFALNEAILCCELNMIEKLSLGINQLMEEQQQLDVSE